MRNFQISLIALLILAVLPLFPLAGCGGGISGEQRESYLKLAQDYESKANTAQAQAVELWGESYSYYLKDSQRQAIVDSAKAKEDLASEYRQQALKYRELAAK